MEKWRRVWRQGMVPQLTLRGLFALRTAILADDPRLVQGVVSSPPPLDALAACPVQGACAIGYCGWQGEDRLTVGEVIAFFDRTCAAADEAFHESAACRFFLHWFDEAPRADMRRELLAEVEIALRTKATHASQANKRAS